MFLVGSNCFLFGALLGVFAMLGMNRVTFNLRLQTVEPVRHQMVAPVGRWNYKRFTAERGFIWRKIEPWIRNGWEQVSVEEQRGVGIFTIVMRKFE